MQGWIGTWGMEFTQEKEEEKDEKHRKAAYYMTL